MAFTNHSGLFAAVHENAINTTIGHLRRQRPSLFNYATLIFTQALSAQFCVPIAPPPGGGPLFTVEPQLPVLGAPQPLGLDWCLQLSNVSIDLYPGHTLTLPPELDPIGSQQFALHLQACFGLACPDDRVVENLAAEMEAAVAASMLGVAVPPADVQPVPAVNVLCSCLPAGGAPSRRAAAADRAHGEPDPGHHPDAPGQRHRHRPARHRGPGARVPRRAGQPGRRPRPAQRSSST